MKTIDSNKFYMPNELKKITELNYDKEHCYRVAHLVVAVAKGLGLDEDTIKEVYFSALIHDCGKAFLDQRILNKKGPLTLEDRRHINKHTIYSASEALKYDCDIELVRNILYHHENYDGSGYPAGIKKEEIPLGAMIIKVCDIYDALTSDRVYRKKLTSDEAIRVMDQEINTFNIDVYSALKNYLAATQEEPKKKAQ